MAGRTMPAGAAAAPGAGWLRGPIWDSVLLGFGWLPLYAWFTLGLGLGGAGQTLADEQRALRVATTVVLGLTFIHRHYTLVLVYGDRETFGQRVRAFVAAPLAVLALIGAARALRGAPLAGPLTVWGAVLIATGLWNVWHVLQQRYGILRAYGVKARGGLESPGAGRRDRAMVWAMALLTAALTLLYRGDSMALHPRAQALWGAVGPWLDRGGRWALIALATAAAALISRWVAAEGAATPAARAPRLLFVASTAALCGVFVVHGPVVGYLCFGAAHAIEYLAFVHHVGEGRYRGGARPGVASRLLRRPLPGALALAGGLGLAYVLLQPLSGADLYVTYYVATSLLHYLYDGWIWRGPRAG